ncbi:SGNH/GDSL hydrolase family protein [soil metagenome]
MLGTIRATDRVTARHLLLLACLMILPPGTSPVAAGPSVQPKPDPSFPFSTEIEDFAKANAEMAIPDATLFLGSSSIRLWNVEDSFPKLRVINRGFGGATTPDVLHYYERLRPRESPRSVIVYVGENDLSAGASPDKVAADILTLLGRLRSDFPRARIACLSLKPSPIRWTSYPKMQAVNGLIASRARAMGFDYLEVGGVLLATDGLPDASLFRADGLHMNPRGYALWNRLVADWLNAGRPHRGPHPVGVAVANQP